MDAVEQAGSGHPGTAMSLAPAAYLLFQRVLKHDPADPEWVGRDRFVLSAGHSSLTLYLQLYLSGYGLELDDIERLRTWGSRTPGHPEHRLTPGVETTTGPLGQGLGNAVGMAMAARRERGLLDPAAAPGASPFDHHIYVIASDGDVEEGVSHEVCALAGHQQLGSLVVVYDDNNISIEDDTRIAKSEDVCARYEAYGWHVQRVDWRRRDGYTEDIQALYRAFSAARDNLAQPSLIALRTIIAWPAPTKQNTGEAHGAALGADEVAATKRLLGFDPDVAFPAEDQAVAHVRKAAGDRAARLRADWAPAFTRWRQGNAEQAALLERLSARRLPDGWAAKLPVFPASSKGMATRRASGEVLNCLAGVLPELWGGSADLAGSNNTSMKGEPSFIPTEHQTRLFPGGPHGRILHFGVREHAMGAVCNGIALHGLTRPYGGTFLVFSDYMRPAVRLAALMGIGVTFVWTHDSIGLGEDGPTHQPVEHLWALRAIPGLDVVRPADANETAVAWRTIIEHHDRPAGLCLSRQSLPVFDRGDVATGEVLASAEGTARGGYVLAEAPGGEPAVILIATGSEVQIALAARQELGRRGIGARVVSMPCVEWFTAQDSSYQQEVLPPKIRARVCVEAGVAQGWRAFAGDAGACVSLEHFGASASYQVLYEKFGFTTEAVVAAAVSTLERASNNAGKAGAHGDKER
jgi:transketolase